MSVLRGRINTAKANRKKLQERGWWRYWPFAGCLVRCRYMAGLGYGIISSNCVPNGSKIWKVEVELHYVWRRNAWIISNGTLLPYVHYSRAICSGAGSTDLNTEYIHNITYILNSSGTHRHTVVRKKLKKLQEWACFSGCISIFSQIPSDIWRSDFSSRFW